ncbi:MAG: guanylate kinase [Patescibacteria group bacterium]|jgi:guanylate kinase
MNNKPPLIVIVSGPSGAGKNSVVAPLRAKTDDFAFSISYTTRQTIRPDEIDGRDYHFVSSAEFAHSIQKEEFLEWQDVFENRYGTKRSDFEKLLTTNKTVVALLDVKGAMCVKGEYPNVVTVFVMPPDLDIASERLEKRATDSETSRNIRKERYALEMDYKDKYDYIIVNDDLPMAQQELSSIISSRLLKN